jgi:hypothetical protein
MADVVLQFIAQGQGAVVAAAGQVKSAVLGVPQALVVNVPPATVQGVRGVSDGIKKVGHEAGKAQQAVGMFVNRLGMVGGVGEVLRGPMGIITAFGLLGAAGHIAFQAIEASAARAIERVRAATRAVFEGEKLINDANARRQGANVGVAAGLAPLVRATVAQMGEGGVEQAITTAGRLGRPIEEVLQSTVTARQAGAGAGDVDNVLKAADLIATVTGQAFPAAVDTLMKLPVQLLSSSKELLASVGMMNEADRAKKMPLLLEYAGLEEEARAEKAQAARVSGDWQQVGRGPDARFGGFAMTQTAVSRQSAIQEELGLENATDWLKGRVQAISGDRFAQAATQAEAVGVETKNIAAVRALLSPESAVAQAAKDRVSPEVREVQDRLAKERAEIKSADDVEGSLLDKTSNKIYRAAAWLSPITWMLGERTATEANPMDWKELGEAREKAKVASEAAVRDSKTQEELLKAEKSIDTNIKALLDLVRGNARIPEVAR